MSWILNASIGGLPNPPRVREVENRRHERQRSGRVLIDRDSLKQDLRKANLRFRSEMNEKARRRIVADFAGPHTPAEEEGDGGPNGI
jgi:hypothetical protein